MSGIERRQPVERREIAATAPLEEPAAVAADDQRGNGRGHAYGRETREDK